jgi:hypothetical protein
MLTQPVTSATHPIHLSWIWELDAGGALATSFCPGKRVPAAQERRAWHRTLAEDLQRLRSDFRITTIACLLNDAELRVRCCRNCSPPRRRIWRLGLQHRCSQSALVSIRQVGDSVHVASMQLCAHSHVIAGLSHLEYTCAVSGREDLRRRCAQVPS